MSARDQHGLAAPHGEFQIIGKPQRKIDGAAKATGSALYTDDLTLPGMLHAKTLRSPHPHARIVSIDTSAAQALPGVHGVITGKDLPTPYGVIPWTPDETALAVDKVRFIGDEVAAVAAVDEDTALRALELIQVEYEVLHSYQDPKEALERDEPTIHQNKRGNNVSKRVKLDFGEVDQAFETSPVVIKGDYSFHGSTHAAIEPHCALAQVDGDGLLTLWSATQITHYVHRALSSVLDLAPHRIRVIQPAIGGAFGGKSDPFSLEFCVAKLAQITGRPVKMLWTREEVFYAHRGRHPMEMQYSLAANEDGKIQGVDARILIDGGSYSSFGLVTTYYSGQLLTGPYDFPAYRFDSTRVFTNKPPCGPKRGHGSVQPRFAFEVQLDELAEKLSIDPIELRRRNSLGPQTKTVNGQRITSCGFDECLLQVEEASDWKNKRQSLGPGKGVGVAGSMYITGTNYPIYPNEMPQAGIQIKVDRSGVVTVFSGANDIGQGSSSMVAYVVAEELGLTLDMLRVVAADTDLCPVDLGAYSSRVTFMVGNAAIDASRKLRKLVVGSLAKHWDVEERRVRLVKGEALDLEDPERHMTMAEAFQITEVEHDTLGATGSYNTPTLGGDYRGGSIGASPAYSFSAHVVEVEVDEETGRIDVKEVWCAHDCGKALNPILVSGQIEGSVYMGIAEALYEHHQTNRFGLHSGPSLLDYPLATTLDTPEIKSLIVESNDPEGPYGAKEAGEGPLHSAIPALSNAIFDAVGIRLRHLPFTPDVVLRALREKRANDSQAPNPGSDA